MRRVPSDWLLGGLGVGMATASASFAAYMIATAPAQVVGFGSKEFRVFAAYDRRPGVPGAGHPRTTTVADATPSATPRTVPPPDAPPRAAPQPQPQSQPLATSASLAAMAPGIDPEPTGSVPAGQIPTGQVPTGPAATGAAASGGSFAARSLASTPRPPGGQAAALAEFRLRDVVRGQAIIEHRGRLSMVRPGTVLTGAGEVLSIEHRAEGWVVTTTSGTITGT